MQSASEVVGGRVRNSDVIDGQAVPSLSDGDGQVQQVIAAVPSHRKPTRRFSNKADCRETEAGMVRQF